MFGLPIYMYGYQRQNSMFMTTSDSNFIKIRLLNSKSKLIIF